VVDEMEKRQDRLEWEVGVLKERYDHMNDRIGEMSIRMDQQHRELLAAIGSLKDDRARAEGAAEAQLQLAQRDRDRMKLIATIVGVLGLLVALGWIGDTKALPTRDSNHEERNLTDP